MRLLLATTSAHKLREARAILARPRLEILGLADLDRAVSEPEEPFQTFTANALHKATHYATATGLTTLADDSGIRVDALGGEPGVRSKRFAHAPGLAGVALDEANNRRLLERLEGVPAERRTAHYACAAALARPGTPLLTTLGTCSGRILEQPRGEGGFGYDPLFLLPDRGRSMAELEPAEKNRISHRGRAFRALAAVLTDALRNA